MKMDLFLPINYKRIVAAAVLRRDITASDGAAAEGI